ncbi:MAG: hypothetical protein WAW11_03545 [Patescibacteria group bacterium]
MLNIILMLSGKIIVITIILAIVIFSPFFIWIRKRKKEKIAEPEISKTEKVPPGLGDYDFKHERGEWDYNLSQSLMNDQILIREVRVFNPKEEKDKLIFASSLPFYFTSEDRKALKEVIPELIEVSVLNSHELMIVKSPAANFFDFKKDILTHLFIFLNRRYAWMKKKTTISLHYIEQNELNCHMRYMTKDHARLGVLLGDITGVTNWLKTVAQMEEKDTYDFNIQKEFGVEWKELLPKIQEVFRQYFTGGVEFIGPN